jgi:hypothetical protein
VTLLSSTLEIIASKLSLILRVDDGTGSKNPFVRIALEGTLALALELRGADEFLSALGSGLDIHVLGANDFYSQRASVSCFLPYYQSLKLPPLSTSSQLETSPQHSPPSRPSPHSSRRVSLLHKSTKQALARPHPSSHLLFLRCSSTLEPSLLTHSHLTRRIRLAES